MSRIYADYAATTPLCQAAQEAMSPWLAGEFGNASSLYEEGRRARAAIDEAREVVSEALGCLFAEAIFTGSGTEAANLAVVGTALAHLKVGLCRPRILFGASEHHCVLHTEKVLSLMGFKVESIPIDSATVVNLEALESQVADDVLLVSVMHANNETGSIQPAREVASIASRFGALYHCDAVQSFGVWPWRVADLGADLVTLSAHKIGGPKGIGSLYVRAGVKPAPLIAGGGQEREMRAGTESVMGIVGFAAAVRDRVSKSTALGTRYPAAEAFVANLGSFAKFTIGEKAQVLPGHVHVQFEGVSAETLLIRLDREGVSASAGAACSSGSLDPSHVLLAAGLTEEEARQGVRFSFGPDQTPEVGAECARRVIAAVGAIRASRK